MTLEIKAIMNSPVEDIFAFKTCCGVRAFDQNLEIHITNRGERDVGVLSHFDLKSDQGTLRVATLMPHGEQRVGPGEIIAFYCNMDETLWAKAQEMVFYDSEGKSYSVDLISQDAISVEESGQDAGPGCMA